MRSAKLGSLLASDAGLQPVVARAREIGALSKLCFDFLPPGLARLVRAVNIKDSRLMLLTASPAAAAKLKMLSGALCNFLLQQGAKVNSVSVRVQPIGVENAAVLPRSKPRLDEGAVAALRELYRRLPDSPARAALKTLLDHQLAGKKTRR